MTDHEKLKQIVAELNTWEDSFPRVRVWVGMTEVDFLLAQLEADDIVEKVLEKYRDAFVNPTFFKNLVEFCQVKYRTRLKDWKDQNGGSNSQSGSGPGSSGKAS